MFAGMAYDTVTVMMKAINKAKSTDLEKVNAASEKVKVSTMKQFVVDSLMIRTTTLLRN